MMFLGRRQAPACQQQVAELVCESERQFTAQLAPARSSSVSSLVIEWLAATDGVLMRMRMLPLARATGGSGQN